VLGSLLRVVFDKYCWFLDSALENHEENEMLWCTTIETPKVRFTNMKMIFA
jgi:hypothetical protein